MTLAPICNWVDVALGFVYPEVCALCEEERAVAKDGFVCGSCQRHVQFIRAPFCNRCGLPFDGDISGTFECSNCKDVHLHFSSARSAVVAKTVVLEAIHRFKYSRHLWFEPFLAGLLLQEAVPVLREQEPDLIVPVPLFSVKEREREFNQAERLARHLSTATGVPSNHNLLRRVTPTLTQTRLTKQQRAENIRGAFMMRKGIKLDGEKIILVDDVFTTGATTSECARILRKAGAGDVSVWTVARGL